MSAFRFQKPNLPRRLVGFVGYGLVALIAGIGFVFLAGASDRDDQIADQKAMVDRAAAIGNADQAGAGLDASAFYTGETPQLAQAVLQSNLQALAEAHRINIDVIRTDQIDQIDRFVRLNLTVNGIAPEVELGAFLHGISVLEPIVVTQQISLRRARESRRDAERRVSFQIQLYGLAQR